MSRVIRCHWPGNSDAPSRRGRQPCEYEAYVPDPLANRKITLDGDVAADVADAEAAIVRLNAEASVLADTEALARLLLRAESVASSRIEGLEVGARKLLRAELAQELGERALDVAVDEGVWGRPPPVKEILGNIDAMKGAISEIGSGDQITVDTLLRFHSRLMVSYRDQGHAGKLRHKQNWIGGSAYNPCSAAFVPPPPELVPDLLADLCAFCNGDSLPAVAQAALAHAQFETIHPFADGNGRTGRGLIHLVLRRRGLATRVLPPISLVLATWANDYVDGLTATRYHGAAAGKEAHEGRNLWIGRFAGACTRAVEDAGSFEQRVQQIQGNWRAQLGRVRSGSATDLLLHSLPGAPVLTVSGAAELIHRSFPQTNQAVARLTQVGVLSQVTIGRRNRAFEAKDIINAFTDLERQIASPGGDTRSSEPSRAFPAQAAAVDPGADRRRPWRLMGLRDPVVCIVGAGPAGLVTAHLLRQAGISFVVLERHEADGLRARVKAGMIENRTVELLRPYGLATPITEHGRQVGMCEFRADGQAFVLDYAKLCGGRGHYIYPQQELVADWAEQLLASGGDLRFGVEATSVEQIEDRVVVSAVRGTAREPVRIECEAVAVCGGAGSILPTGVDAVAATYPTRWLSLIAAVPPSTAGTIYGLHARGFAGQMHRSATVTRFMLEVPTGEDYRQWDDDRIWAELEDRLAATGRPRIERGEFTERDILDHRVQVCDPMQHGRVFLAGDAAHLITPAGGKGMNIAIQDAVELACGLRERYGDPNDGGRLDSYSQTRLPLVWRHQEFSNLMLSLFSTGTASDAAGRDFAYGLRRARLDLIVSNPRFSRWFAHAYAGVDE